MRRKKYVSLLFVLGIFLVPQVSSAFDINYANLERVAGDQVVLKYRTTDKYTFAICSITGECGNLLFGEYEGNNAPNLFPVIAGKTNYTKSVDGRSAVVEIANVGGQVYRVVYDINGQNAIYRSLVPHFDPAIRTSVTYAGDAAVFLGSNGVVTRYDLDSKAISSVSTGRTSFPFWSLSEHGNLVASYNYNTEEQEVWRLGSGKEASVSAKAPSYVVFNENETHLAYLDNVSDFNKLFVVELSNIGGAKEVSRGNFTVVEYEFIGDTLYYIANTDNDPYAWNLYSYDLKTGEIETVDRGVAYDDEYGNLKKTSKLLFYEKVDGKNKNVVVLDASSGRATTLSAVTSNPSSDRISREVVSLRGVPGVLLSPDSRRNERLPLVVWLHGGPMRQTSVDFHPFYGYAVYDEILERLASEAYVLKLDYTGSWGHGKELREALVGNIGNLDVRDVFTAIDEIKRDKNIDEVYLVGNSYGGYLGLRSLAENPREIEAVVSIAGVTDWRSLIERIPSSPFANSFYGAPYDTNLPLYDQASVYSRLNDVGDQKMVLVYGTEDSSVPTWQSTEFYALAKALNKNVEIVKYKGEGHTILKKDNLIDLCKQIGSAFNLSASVCRE